MQLGFFKAKILSTFLSFECRIVPCNSKLKTRNSKLEEILRGSLFHLKLIIGPSA